MLSKPNFNKHYKDSKDDYYPQALEKGCAELGLLALHESMSGHFVRAVKSVLSLELQYPTKWEQRSESSRSKNGPEMSCLFEGAKVNGADMALALLELGIPARVFEPGAVYPNLTLVNVRKNDFGMLKLKLGS